MARTKTRDPLRILQPLALLLALLLCSAAASAEPRLGALGGEVTVGTGEPVEWRAARTGDALAPGDRIRTGPGAHAEVELGSATVRLYENSVLRLPMGSGAAGPDSVRLEEGRSLFDVVKRKLGLPRFEVETPQVVVSVKGTRFEVVLGRDLAEVSVFHGVVGLREPRANELVETLVREGFAARGGVGQPFELEVSMEPDPWSRWKDVPPARLQQESRLLDREHLEARGASEARRAARRSSDRQVIEQAARRNPRVAERIAELLEQKRAIRAEDGGLRRDARGSEAAERRPERNMPAAPAPGSAMRERDPEDVMDAMMKGPSRPDCFPECGRNPGSSYRIVEDLMSYGLEPDDIQASIESAVEDLGSDQLLQLYTTGGDYETLLLDYFTVQQNLDSAVAQLLVDLMEAVAGSP